MDIKKIMGSVTIEASEELKNWILKTKSEFNAALENYILENLKEIGHEFETREDFYDFAKRRITRVTNEDSPEVHYFIDFRTENKKLIGITREDTYVFEDDKLIIG